MKEKLICLDKDIIELCRKIAHYVQRKTGVTCYGIARLGVYLMAVHAMMGIVNCIHQYLWFEIPLYYLLVLGYIAFSAFIKDLLLSKAEELIGSNARVWLLPKVIDYKFRLASIYLTYIIMVLTVSLCFSYQDLSVRNIVFLNSLPVGDLIYIYFGYIDPLPPGKSKVRKWFDSRFGFFKPATQNVG